VVEVEQLTPAVEDDESRIVRAAAERNLLQQVCQQCRLAGLFLAEDQQVLVGPRAPIDGFEVLIQTEGVPAVGFGGRLIADRE
jgi:hypothetical protein